MNNPVWPKKPIVDPDAKGGARLARVRATKFVNASVWSSGTFTERLAASRPISRRLVYSFIAPLASRVACPAVCPSLPVARLSGSACQNSGGNETARLSKPSTHIATIAANISNTSTPKAPVPTCK